MTNNEKFNQLINSCGNPRLIYNTLLALEPCVKQRDDTFQESKIIIGKLLALFNKSESN